MPVIWLHENNGRVTVGFAGQGKMMVILTLAYFGLQIAYLSRVAVPFGALVRDVEYKMENSRCRFLDVDFRDK